jgi:hypothetical protein
MTGQTGENFQIIEFQKACKAYKFISIGIEKHSN